MKKSYLILLLIFILCYMLIDPVHGMEGVKNGLLLWYDRILPALLPFSIISYILVASDNLSFFSRILHPVIKKLIPVSPDGVYPLLAGFLFGFPLGSKIIGQLSENGQLRSSEAQIQAVTTSVRSLLPAIRYTSVSDVMHICYLRSCAFICRRFFLQLSGCGF